MVRKTWMQKALYTCFIALIILVSGCSSPKNATGTPMTKTGEDTPTPVPVEVLITKYGPLCKVSLSYIRFPDGSELYLAPDTEIEILSIEELSTGISSYEVLLSRGQLVILSQPPQEIQFTVISPEGYIVKLIGSLMFVGIEEDLGKITAICVDGVCELGSDLQSLVRLAAESEGWLDENGGFLGPFEIDITALSEGCGEDFIAVQLPASPTPDLDATATAFCGNFEEENPGTPCP